MSATFRTARTLPFDPGTVWAAFARPDLLARWWGPTGFTNTFDAFDFRPGGRWVSTMHGPDGAHYPNESVFLALDAPRTFAIDHVSPPRFTLTVTLGPDGDGTRIDWVQAFADPAVAERVRHIVEPANEQNLDRLAALLDEVACEA